MRFNDDSLLWLTFLGHPVCDDNPQKLRTVELIFCHSHFRNEAVGVNC